VVEPLHILFEDNHVLAVVKPAPLLTQAPGHVPSLEAQVKAYLKEKYAKKGNVYLGIPHRLDRPVSGVVLFARNTKAAQRLAEQFQKHEIEKVYWAVVEIAPGGEPPPEAGTWTDWLRKVPLAGADQSTPLSRAEIVTADTEGAKSADLTFRRLALRPETALLELRPRTGRMHQIRVQAAARGWPVQGDVLYGATRSFGPSVEEPRDRLIALHGRSITFLHPIRYEPVTLLAPLPETWGEWATLALAESERSGI
jgi:23S rRNA pseudouridine1911/1915/1917 synthase